MTGLLDLLFPRPAACCLCADAFAPRGPVEVCDSCLATLPLVGELVCDTCGRPLRPWELAAWRRQTNSAAPVETDSGLGWLRHLVSRFVDLDAPRCPDCSRPHASSSSLLVSRAAMVYTGAARELLLSMKFAGRYSLSRPLSKLMYAYMDECRPFRRPKLLVPVPMHRDKLGERGYNQAELLARGVGELAGISVSDCMSRHTLHQTQSKVGGRERRSNVAGCFAVHLPGEVRGIDVCVIDDVFTTGSTARECAGELMKAGAKSVVALTAAVVVPGTEPHASSLGQPNAHTGC